MSVVGQTKTCAHCKEPKGRSEFTNDSSRKDGLCPYCRECNRRKANEWGAANKDRKNRSRLRWLSKEGSRQKMSHARRRWKLNNQQRVKKSRLKREYATTPEEVDQKLKEQGGCGICGTKSPTKKGWDTDHCHKSQKFRGVLCHKCNLLLGLCGDNAQVLEKAIAYLRKYETANQMRTPASIEECGDRGHTIHIQTGVPANNFS